MAKSVATTQRLQPSARTTKPGRIGQNPLLPNLLAHLLVNEHPTQLTPSGSDEKEVLAEVCLVDNNMAATEETPLQLLIAIAILLLYDSPFAFENSLEGSYVVSTLNGRSLPAELRVPATAGDFRLFRLEQGVLSLQPSGHFTLYFRYYHQLVRRGDRPTATPVISESQRGTYTINRDRILLTPEKKSRARSRAPIPATIVGTDIRATYMLENDRSNQRITLVLRRDPSYW